jgi:hypothetical protein
VAVLNILLSNSKREEQALMVTIAGLVGARYHPAGDQQPLRPHQVPLSVLAMEIVLKAAAVGVVGSVLALLLRKYAPEMSLLLAMAVGF